MGLLFLQVFFISNQQNSLTFQNIFLPYALFSIIIIRFDIRIYNASIHHIITDVRQTRQRNSGIMKQRKES
jgi:hypothetical protein